MAGSYNRIILVGNLTRDPEMRTVQSGSNVTKFSIAVNRRTKASDETTYVDIVAWDNGNYRLAQTCNQYLKKGMSVLVEGRLAIRSYDDKDGTKRRATEVIIDTMQMLDNKGAGQNQNGDGRGAASLPAGGSRANNDDGFGDPLEDSEIPF